MQNQALDAEPPIASFVKSMLIGGGPVNAAVLCLEIIGTDGDITLDGETQCLQTVTMIYSSSTLSNQLRETKDVYREWHICGGLRNAHRISTRFRTIEKMPIDSLYARPYKDVEQRFRSN